MRAEFQGTIAIVNKKNSIFSNILVQHADKILEYFPWSKEFEKDKFLKPDFTALECVTFAGPKVWAG